MKLNLYSVSDEYISYLRKYDGRIYESKENKRIYERKYVGVVLTIRDINYYIPMSSPKRTDYIDDECTIIRKSTKTIIRMHDGKRLYGTLRISNMIPVPITELEPYFVKDEKNLKYKQVILGELRFIKYNSDRIIKHAKIVYSQKIKKLEISYIKNTVDFRTLEQKYREWIQSAN